MSFKIIPVPKRLTLHFGYFQRQRSCEPVRRQEGRICAYQIRSRRRYVLYKSQNCYEPHLIELSIDLTSLFTWNTKQVFIYITASYPSHYNTTSQTPSPPTTAVIWDRIISAPSTPYSTLSLPFSKTSATLTKQKKTKQAKGKSSALGGADTTIPPHPGSLALKNVRPKYQIGDPSGVLGERGNATLEFGWNVQPWVGALLWTRTQSVGRWQGLQGGRSEVFTFPEVKGKKKATAAAAAAESGGAQAGT